jgi:hypothetical protein
MDAQMRVSEAEKNLLTMLRETGIILAMDHGTDEGTSCDERGRRFSDGMCKQIAQCVKDGRGDRPGSWEAEIGRQLLPSEIMFPMGATR